MRWESSGVSYYLQCAEEYGFQHAELYLILGGMVQVGAFPSNEESLGFTATSAQAPVMDRLREAGLAHATGIADPRWFSHQGAQASWPAAFTS